MKPIALIALLIISCKGFSHTLPDRQAGDTVRKYFNAQSAAVEKDSASYIRVGYPKEGKWYAREYLINGNILTSEGYYTNESLQVEDGPFRFYSGKTYSGSGSYKQGKRTGSWQSMYDDGKKKDTAYYVDGIMVGAGRVWYNSGKVKTTSQTDEHGNGTEKGFYENGKIEHQGTYSNGKQNGKWTYYHANGKPSSIETMREGELVTAVCFDEEGNAVTKNCGAEVESDFHGGQAAWLKYLSKRASQAQYPPAYFKKQIYGTVVVQFIVDENGAVTNVEVIQSVHPALDAIAADVIRASPKWEPAMQHNRPVKSYKKQPIAFPKYPY
jgi:TonB family protein